MKQPYIPHGCDQQGRISTGRVYRSTVEAFPDADRAGSISGPFRSTDASAGRLLLAAIVLVGLIIATAFGVQA